MSDQLFAHLIVGGEYHDFDFVRLELLKLLAEDDRCRVSCTNDFHDLQSLQRSRFLLTYTSNLIPAGVELAALREFLERGGRWLAIHGSAALTRFKPPPVELWGIKLPGLTDTPDLAPDYMRLLGCRFVSHLAQQSFVVTATQPEQALVQGLAPFEVTDEPYILEFTGECEVLLESRYIGEAPGYVRGPWLEDLPRPQLLRHRVGAGEALYLAPGHACGRFDLRPFIDELPPMRGPWVSPNYLELLRRSIRWGIGA
jgi:hypothetical protein